jgi:Flp pilus assembly protein TadG
MSGKAGAARLKTQKLKNAERGQALLETALVAPLLIILLLGIIEVGRYAELAIVVSDAARTGAVYGAQNLAAAVDTKGITIAAQADANLGVNGQGANDLTVTPSAGLLGSGAANPPSPCTTITDAGTPLPYVIVRTSYTANSLFTSKQYTFNGCAQMQVAQ